MKKYLIMGLSLILLTNAFILGGVAYNRSQPVVSQLELSGREFALSYGFMPEDSATVLRIDIRGASYFDSETEGVFLRNKFGAETLAKLGLDGEASIPTEDIMVINKDDSK